MKYLDPTQATDLAQQPVKNGTLQFLQDSHKENLSDFFVGLLGGATPNGPYDPTVVYALWGCAETGTIINNQIVLQFQPGAYFYNGEVFRCLGGTFTLTNSNVVVVKILTTPYSPASPLQADPVLFTDGVSRSVHDIRTMQLVFGPAGGSGVTNYVSDTVAIQYPTFNLAAEITDRKNGDNNLQALIGTVPTGHNLQSEITTIQGNITTLQNQVYALDAGWQEINLAALATLLNPAGAWMTNIDGTLVYKIWPDNTFMCSGVVQFVMNQSANGTPQQPTIVQIDMSQQTGMGGKTFNSNGISIGTKIGTNYQVIVVGTGTTLQLNSLDGANIPNDTTHTQYAFQFTGCMAG